MSMRIFRRIATACIGIGLSLLVTNCGGGKTSSTTPTTYVLTIDSTDPASGVVISYNNPLNNVIAQGTTSFTVTESAGTTLNLTAPATASGNTFSSWTGCTSASTETCTVTLNANTTITANYTATVAPTTYVLTVDSTNPASGVAIGVTPADINSATSGTTAFTRTYDSGTSVTLTAPATSGSYTFSSWTGCTTASTETCTVTLNANTTVTANYTATVTPTTYVLTVDSTNPASGVAIGVTPADINSATSGTTAFTRTYDSGTSVTLTAPATSGSYTFSSWTGCTTVSTETCAVTLNANTTVTANYATVKTTPTVTVTPATSSITTTQALSVTVTVSGTPTPTGTVTLSSGSYTSAVATLTSGSATIDIPAGSLAAGNDTLTAAYTPDSASSSTYNTATGSSSAVTVTQPSTVTVDQSSDIANVTDQILGMNLASWYNIVTNKTAIVDAFQTAGIKAVRWPGGSWSDLYHWSTNANCNVSPYGTTAGQPNPNDTFANFVSDIAVPAGLDVALTADYGTDASCTGGGDPTEAAAWVTAAIADGITVSHMTVGNEEYGSTWEEDLHSSPNDPTTYANAVVTGYYPAIKAASPSTLVGVDVEADNKTGGWDDTVLGNAKDYYDFVEYHFYPQAPDQESDATLVHSSAQELTTNLNTIKSELSAAGKANTPIYVGEIGSVYTNPGKQSWSITQGLFAGQVLGEMMNAGVARATWWIGFGNCNGTNGNDSSSLYGWQDFGAYNVFSDGPSETSCPGDGAIGTMSPTARAFQLFSNVAVTGESALTATVAGDTTDVRAYAATHSGGTALVLFNLNAATSKPVTVTLSGQTSSTGVTVITYDRDLYDQTDATIPVWADPTTTSLGAQSLPLTLTLTPWSMNVVMIK